MLNNKKTKTLNKDISFGRVSLKEKAILFRNLAIMLRSGLTITEALDILGDQASGKLKKVLFQTRESVSAGNTLASSLFKFPKVFSSFLVNVISAGESSGTLDDNLENIAGKLTEEKELMDKIRGAMFYPIVVLSLSFVLGLVIAFYILPKITPIFKGLKIELPATTRFLIWLSSQIEARGFILFLAIIGVIVFLIWFLRLKLIKPVLHWLFLRIPIIRMFSRHKNLAQFTNTLGTLLKSGLNIDEALSITADTLSNYHYRKSVNKARVEISQGTKIADNLEIYSQYFPKMATSMIRVGEKSGKLEEELFNLSRIYKTEVENAAKTLSNAIEPILLIVIGGVVGGLALSIITPIYKITGNVYR